MYEHGQYAAKLMLALLAGESAPAQVLVPARLTVRQSCGCLDPAVAQARVEPVEQPIWVVSEEIASVQETLSAGRAGCLAAIEQTIEENERKSEWIAQLLDAFLGELNGESAGGFLPALEGILRQVIRGRRRDQRLAEGDFSVAQPDAPRLAGRPRALIRAEDLWHQARVMIGEQTQHARLSGLAGAAARRASAADQPRVGQDDPRARSDECAGRGIAAGGYQALLSCSVRRPARNPPSGASLCWRTTKVGVETCGLRSGACGRRIWRWARCSRPISPSAC